MYINYEGKIKELPPELIRYIGKSVDNQDVELFATSSKQIQKDLLPELERRRFRPKDKTELKDALRLYYLCSGFRRLATDKCKKKYGDISGWDVSNVRDMSHMFAYAKSFNGDISNWDVRNVTNMRGMFTYAKSFNRDLSGWDVSKVTDMRGMFNDAKSFKKKNAPWYFFHRRE